MESDTYQEEVEERLNIYSEFPFLKYIKGRLVSYVNPETKKIYVGHVAMFYLDTGKLRVDWDNGATTYHDFKKGSKWIFHAVKKNLGNTV